MPDRTVLAPHITTVSTRLGGAPCVGDTRLTTCAPAAFWSATDPENVSVALAQYPGLTREQAIAAIAFEAGRRYEASAAGRRDLRRALHGALGAARELIDDVLGEEG